MQRLRDLLLIVWVAVMLFTGLPSWIPGIAVAEKALWGPADVFGLAQCGWQLFAPHPSHDNVWLEVTLTSDQGQTATWESPNWGQMSDWQRVRHVRFYSYTRVLAAEDAEHLHGPYVRYVATQRVAPDGQRWVRATLTRHWWDIPRRHARAESPVPLPWPPPRDTYPDAKVIAEIDL